MRQLSREQIEESLNELSLDWDADEDARLLIDLLLESYTLEGAWTWLSFHNRNLGGTPLMLLESGRHKDVFAEARALVGRASSV